MNSFAEDVHQGLSSEPKYLSSKYFYDELGDELFVQITQMPEYYLTGAENEILDSHLEDILDEMKIHDASVEIIELGAGDGHKAAQFLKPLKNHANLTFIPIDISMNALTSVEDRFTEELPEIELRKEQGEYFSAIRELNGHRKKIVLFLGSNIGNMSESEASQFMSNLSHVLNSKDQVLLGVDLKKSPEIILPAYNDAKGITSRFNLNLLHRINRELGGNFDVNAFVHQPEYDMIEGEARSYLQSLKNQEVYLSDLNKSYAFLEGEKILTERSQKYDDAKIENILSNSDLSIQKKFTDSNNFFADYLLAKA